MGTIIKSIKLKNWFVYKGDYNDNTLNFKPRFNVIVSANDVGKSKLHNAFRWVLEDRVIVRADNISDQRYQLVKLNEDTLIKESDGKISGILNLKEFRTTPINEQISIGVQIHYRYEHRTISEERKITKELILRKEADNKVSVVSIMRNVKKVERGHDRSCSDSFDSCLEKIIPNSLRSFYLVTGESLDLMTPLGGEQLKTTLKKFVDISFLSDFLITSQTASKKISNLKNDFEKKDARGKKVNEEYVNKKQDLEIEIKELEEKILPELKELKDAASKKVKQYQAKYENSKKKRKQKIKLDKFDKKLEVKDALIDASYKQLKENYVKGDFYLGNLLDYTLYTQNFSDTIETIKDYSSQRHAELQNELSKEKQEMLYALDKSQPKPEILKQMVDKRRCYVCSNHINDEGKRYIEELLIPYFEGKLKNQDDKQIKTYESIIEVFKGFNLKNYPRFEENKIQEKINFIVKLEDEKKAIEEEKANFLEEYGDVTITQDDDINFTTYDEAKNDENKFEFEYLEELKQLELKVKELKNHLKTAPGNSQGSEETALATNFESFMNKLNISLVDIIDKDYKNFKESLQGEVNENFKRFTKHNRHLNSQNVIIDYNLNRMKEPNFDIKVVDQTNFNMDDGGGASQSLRQLSLIFGLINLANKKFPNNQTNYPFIADAPTSNMTSTLAYTFYEHQLMNSDSQNILITKELWDDRNDSLNREGKELLDETKQHENSTFCTLISKKNNNLNKSDIEIIKEL